MDSSNDAVNSTDVHIGGSSRYHNSCAICGKVQTSKNYSRHLRQRHQLSEDAIKQHTSVFRNQQVQNPIAPQPLPVHPIRLTYTRENQFRGCIRTINVSLNGHGGLLISSIVQEGHQDLLRELRRDLSTTTLYKVQFGACVFISNIDNEDREWCLSNRVVPFNDTFIFEGAEVLDEKIANYSEHGSGWRVTQITSLTFRLTKTSDLCRLSGH